MPSDMGEVKDGPRGNHRFMDNANTLVVTFYKFNIMWLTNELGKVTFNHHTHKQDLKSFPRDMVGLNLTVKAKKAIPKSNLTRRWHMAMNCTFKPIKGKK